MESKTEEKKDDPDWTRTEDVTAEEVLKMEGLESLTKDQAEETAQFIRIVGGLLFSILEKDQGDAKLIDLNPDKENNKAA